MGRGRTERVRHGCREGSEMARHAVTQGRKGGAGWQLRGSGSGALSPGGDEAAMRRTRRTRVAQAAGVVQAGVVRTGRHGAGGRAADGVRGTLWVQEEEVRTGLFSNMVARCNFQASAVEVTTSAVEVTTSQNSAVAVQTCVESRRLQSFEPRNRIESVKGEGCIPPGSQRVGLSSSGVIKGAHAREEPK
eukprot:scaffold109914_cov63-Phaeocystis_antarctica.AAC.7